MVSVDESPHSQTALALLYRALLKVNLCPLLNLAALWVQ